MKRALALAVLFTGMVIAIAMRVADRTLDHVYDDIDWLAEYEGADA